MISAFNEYKNALVEHANKEDRHVPSTDTDRVMNEITFDMHLYFEEQAQGLDNEDLGNHVREYFETEEITQDIDFAEFNCVKVGELCRA